MNDLAETAKAISGLFDICVEYGIEFEDRDKKICKFKSEGKIGSGALYYLTKYARDTIPKAAFYLELRKYEEVKDSTLESEWMYIYQHIVLSGICSTVGWWSFESMVFEPSESGYLSTYRQAIQKESAKWGATEAVYFPDSYKKKTAFMEDDSEWMTWDALMEKSHRVLGSDMITISDVIRNKLTDDPETGVEAFFDDFSYMPPPPNVISWHREFAASKKSIQQDEHKEGNPLPKSDRERLYQHLREPGKADQFYDLIVNNEVLRKCWEIIIRNDDKALALPYADAGMKHLEKQLQEIRSSHDLLMGDKDLTKRLFHTLTGFNIPAIAFAWNGLQEKAKQADEKYMHVPPLWQTLKATIEPYLELLIANNWGDYLAWVFSSAEFRQYFNNHYEAFLSVCIDSDYPPSHPSAFVGIYNRIQYSKRILGKRS